MIRDIRHTEHQLDITFLCPTLSVARVPMRYSAYGYEETRREHGYFLRTLAAEAGSIIERAITRKLIEQGHLLP